MHNTDSAQTPATTAATATAASIPNETHLVWLDMEMTGLEPTTDRIIEVAVVVTDMHLNLIAQGPVFAIHQSNERLDAMDDWNKNTHGKSGLIDRVKTSTVNEAQAEQALIDFLKQYVPPGKTPLCGNSVHQDRRFMVLYMPKLEQFFHYRNLDVSTLKELGRRWAPAVLKGFEKKANHTALADVMESVAELRYYREHMMKV